MMTSHASTAESTPGPIGAWLIGARGSVATTVSLGLSALRDGLAAPIGIVTATADFADAPLAGFDEIVVGGHDVSDTPLADKARRLADGGMFSALLVQAERSALEEIETRLRPIAAAATDQERIDAMAADIDAFRERNGLRAVVVVDVSSTEPLPADRPEHHDEQALDTALRAGTGVLPASSLAAAAAIAAGAAYAGFTPSAGISLPVLRARADAAGIPYAGQDGKTGETLLRTVLAPMFAARGMRVLSWAGANLLGGGDGETLGDPEAVRSKLASKTRGLHALAGDHVTAPLHIDNVPDLGDQKIAWDSIHAAGFLDSRITLQTTWSAYDSTLAAPLVIDLVRLLGLAVLTGQCGAQEALGAFFKDPVNSDVHAFAEQSKALIDWVALRGEDAVRRADEEAVAVSR